MEAAGISPSKDSPGHKAPRRSGKRADPSDTELMQRYRQILGSISDFTYAFDLDGRFTFVNKPLLDLWGLTLAQSVGKNFFDLQYPDDLAARLQQQIQQVIETRERVVDETSYTSPTGATGYYQYIFSPIIGADGQVEGVAGSTRDITDRKRAVARERFQLALDVAVRPLTDPSEIVAVHMRMLGQLLEVDRSVYCDADPNDDEFNVTGEYARDGRKIMGRHPSQTFGMEAHNLMLAGKAFVVENVNTPQPPLEDPDVYQRLGICAVICAPLHKNGRIVAALAVHQKTPRRWLPEEVELVQRVAARCWESTERARVVRALRENDEFHRFAAEAGRTGSWFVRLDTGEYTLSPMMAELMDFPICQKTATAEELRRRISGEDRAAYDAAIQAAIEKDAAIDVEFRIVLLDGSERVLYSRGAVVRDGAGRPVRLHGASVDRTERQDLLERERAARAEAEAASRAKDKFIAVLSHELRTPLSPVTMTIPSLEADPDMPDKFREDLAMVRRNIELEVKLIDDLLDLSRVASGKLRLQIEQVDAHEVLRHAIHSSMSESAGKHLHLRKELNAEHCRLRADPGRLQQVFWNLLRNAVKFTPEEGQITVRTWNPLGDGLLVVEVKDTGVGIPPESLKKIFDAFEQGDARVTYRFGGLGLGLAIAKAVTEMHGGDITVSSAGVGRGATFQVRLPTESTTLIDTSSLPAG